MDVKVNRWSVDAATFAQFAELSSCERIMENGKRPVLAMLFRRGLYTTVGRVSGGGVRDTIEACRLYPRSKWPFSVKPKTYLERVASRVRGERFYYSVLVRYAGADYVLGPERIQIRQAVTKTARQRPTAARCGSHAVGQRPTAPRTAPRV